ncbi:MAG: glycoside hydrolase family 5 protein [Eubacterium sp.]|nr:glycoside hydrolase family 5 protein [Eubacterium sp.]
MRLACYSSSGEGYNTDSVWKTIDRGVKAASELGMYVIIDWHILMNGNPKTDMSAAIRFFKHFVKKYRGKKNVLWEICNEPNGCEWANDIKPYAKKLIKVIRKIDKKNIIIVGTPTWSQDVDTAADDRLEKKLSKNVCYTLHFYAATHQDNIRNKVKYAVSKGLPILCTEFSICDASGNGALDKGSGKVWMKLLKKNCIGFISWNISNKAESSSLIKPDCMKTGKLKKKDLTESGKWVIKQWK